MITNKYKNVILHLNLQGNKLSYYINVNNIQNKNRNITKIKLL